MKNSSTTSLALSGDRCCIAVLGVLCLCERPEDFNAAQHNAFVDLMGVEGHADGAQQHDGAAAAEMLPKLVEAGENGRLFPDPVGQLRGVDGQLERLEQ